MLCKEFKSNHVRVQRSAVVFLLTASTGADDSSLFSARLQKCWEFLNSKYNENRRWSDSIRDLYIGTSQKPKKQEVIHLV